MASLTNEDAGVLLKLAAKWEVYISGFDADLDSEHLRLALEEAYLAGRASASPGAETVEQRVRADLLAMADNWLNTDGRAPDAIENQRRKCGKELTRYVRTHIPPASSGKTGEPDVETWARAVEAAAETVEEPTDWAPLPYQRRMARSLRRLSPPWMEDRSDGLRDAVSIIAAEESQPAPVSQGPEKPRVAARPDLETCAHGLRRSDCEWCVYSGTQPVPGPERERKETDDA